MLHMSESFLEAIHNRILLFDGAMGTEIQKLNLHPQDFPNNHDGFNDGQGPGLFCQRYNIAVS